MRRPGLLGMGLVLAACTGKEAPFPEPPSGILTSSEAVEAGRRAFLRNCAVCHGTAGYGDGPQARSLQPPPADLRSLRGVRAEPGYWFFRIKEGGHEEPLSRPGSAMPAWGDHMSDEEIWRVVAYLKALTEGRS